MLSSLMAPASGREDHFAASQTAEIQIESEARGRRAKALKQVIRGLEDILLAQNPSVPGTLSGCKMLNLLKASGVGAIAPSGQSDFLLKSTFNAALEILSQNGPRARALSDGLGQLAEGLEWYSAQAGPYASVNFERSHSHAILSGPKKRVGDDIVLLGVTVMAPYTRFPDHSQLLPRVMFPLSAGEYRTITGEWVKGQIGSSIFCAAGREFAMRCTSQPLLALWCQRLAS